MNVLYVFGDSITYGAWDKENYGWTHMVRQYLDAQEPYPGCYFYPLGIHGETTDGLVKRFDNELAARRRHDDNEYAFIFAYGANDATWLTEEKRFKTSVENYAKNLSETVGKAKQLTNKIILLNITPVNEAYSANIASKKKSCLNAYVDDYNAALARIAEQTGAQLVDVHNVLKQAGPDNVMVADGLHPNSAGHQLIFDTVKPVIETIFS